MVINNGVCYLYDDRRGYSRSGGNSRTEVEVLVLVLFTEAVDASYIQNFAPPGARSPVAPPPLKPKEPE
jgi:hypothetical protein